MQGAGTKRYLADEMLFRLYLNVRCKLVGRSPYESWRGRPGFSYSESDIDDGKVSCIYGARLGFFFSSGSGPHDDSDSIMILETLVYIINSLSLLDYIWALSLITEYETINF